MKGMAAKGKQAGLTAQRKQLFLEELERHGVIARAARAASPHSTSKNGCLQTFYDERARNAEFACAWDEAVAQAKGAIEHEIHRRAIEGYEEPIYGGRYKEKIVGTVRKYSDRLLELRARALLPEYRDHRKLEIETPEFAKRAEEEQALAELMEHMDMDELGELEAILQRVSDRKALTMPLPRQIEEPRNRPQDPENHDSGR